jgi:3-dehydroquinate synthase
MNQKPNDETQQSVRVALDARSYDIEIGADLLALAGAHIAPHLKRDRVAIVTDSHVAKHHLQTLQAALTHAGIASTTSIIPAGENSKSFGRLEQLCGWLLDEKIERDDCVIALGGGVIGDLTGFAAAIVRRGLRFIQIPTTLLAQVDSSIGGKTAINAAQGKNLIGAFFQPELVLVDTQVLNTLPARELRAGYAEIVKYGALGNAAFFDWLEANGGDVLAGDAAAQTYAIAESCRSKAGIVARDERESGERALLNLGHTFGHAFEALTGYSNTLLHGEAVALGMVLAFDLSVARGHCAPEDAARLKALLEAAALPVTMKRIGNGNFAADALVGAMAQDKKVKSGKMRFVLVEGLGKSFLTDTVSPADLRAFLIAQGALETTEVSREGQRQ